MRFRFWATRIVSFGSEKALALGLQSRYALDEYDLNGDMTALCERKLIVVGSVGAILFLANAVAVADWLNDLGVVPLVHAIRAEFLARTAPAVITVLLFLLSS